jgi:hypothetical protein
MEARCSSETSVGFRRTTRHRIPEDRTFHKRMMLSSRLEISLSYGLGKGVETSINRNDILILRVITLVLS